MKVRKVAIIVSTISLILAFISCGEKHKEPANSKKNTVVLDGVEKKIHRITLSRDDSNQGNHRVVFYLSDPVADYVELYLNKSKHVGKNIDLTKREEGDASKWNWIIGYYEDLQTKIFESNSKIGEKAPVFKQGTMTIKFGKETDKEQFLEIEIRDGVIKGEGRYGDDKEHTLSIYYNGATEIVDTWDIF